MSRFAMTLRRVSGAVFSTFECDDSLRSWLQRMNAPGQIRDDLLPDLLRRLNRWWVAELLKDEDASEGQGVVAEAIMHTVRAFEDDVPDRGTFAYRLADILLNKGIRPLNRSGGRVSLDRLEEPFLVETVTIPEPSQNDCEKLDKFLIDTLSKRMTKNEVATLQICVAVKNYWISAIEEVELEQGAAAAKPMSHAVKTKLSEWLNVPVSTVEAAMRRLKRSCNTVAVELGREALSSWLEP